MSYLVLARKWRPQQFSEVVGQSHVVRTLTNAIKADRVAHSFVFSGVRGVGKTSLARILAKSLNCNSGPTDTPCGECDSCRTITQGSAVDVIEIDGASNNSVDDIRDLRETVPYVPQVGRYKIYVIDEIHMLSASAFNALLKTLEEPPSHVKFIFATTEAQKIPLTILSRCQRYDFRRIPTTAIVDRIKYILSKESIAADDQALALIGRSAEGSMRDALSILDQILASSSDRITAKGAQDLLGVVDGQVHYDLSRAIIGKDTKEVLSIIRSVDNQGYDIPTFAKGFLEHLRNLVVAGVCKGDSSVLDLPDKETEDLFAQASSVSVDTLHRIFKHFSESFEAVARSSHPKILLEASLARISDSGELVPAATLISQLKELISSGALKTEGGPPGGSGPNGGGPEGGGNTRRERGDQPSTQRPDSSSRISSESPINWTHELMALKKEGPTIASILDCGIPEPQENGRGVLIRFPEEFKTIADMARDRKRDMASKLSKQMGFAVGVEVMVDSSAIVPEVTAKRIAMEKQRLTKTEHAKNHPLVLRAQTDFGATLRDVRLVSDKPDL